MNEFTNAVKELRRNQTDEEKKLWDRLKDKRLLNVKFRRQEPIGNFIIDFVSYENRLIIEIDGSPHKNTITKIHDKQRTAWLESEGFKVIRFWNQEISKDFKGVIDKIKASLK